MNLINVTRSSMPPLQEYVDEIKDIWDSRWLTNNGAKHKQLEKMLKDRWNVCGISLFSNGYQALEAAFSLE